MSTKKIVNIIIVLITVVFISCEKEKVEYTKEYSGSIFGGFNRNLFVIHDESISYYNPDSNKIFSNLFEHQNGRKLGKSIHSLKFYYSQEGYCGVITVEDENRVVFVDKNFIAKKSIYLFKPRNISIGYISGDLVILISYGNSKNGGVAIISTQNSEVITKINTVITPGEIVFHDYIYVLSNGENTTDSIISKFYSGRGPFSLQKVEDISVGKRPVSSLNFIESKTGFYNRSLLIHCLGDSMEQPKIVLYDLVLNKILNTYAFNHENNNSNSILGIVERNDNIFFNSGNKVYLASLDNFDTPELLSENNIISLAEVIIGCSGVQYFYDSQNNCTGMYGEKYYVGISGENNNGQQYLYRFKESCNYEEFFELVDSIPIAPNAKKIVQLP